MKLFISWSGAASQQIAEELRKWIPLILPAVRPFITTTDLDKGAKWLSEISRELDASGYGLVCLTSGNLTSQWLAFEAGALSKLEGRVATLLFGIQPKDVSLPLSMFQGTRYSEAEFRQLVSSINGAVAAEVKRDEAQLDALFPKLWPDLKGAIDLVLAAPGNREQPNQVGSVDLNEVAAEIMSMLRQQNSILSSPERFLTPVLDALDVYGRGGIRSRLDPIAAPRAGGVYTRTSPLEASEGASKDPFLEILSPGVEIPKPPRK